MNATRTYSAVTTCSPAGWNLYGRRMALAFHRHWPKQIPLGIYAEGFTVDCMNVREMKLPEWLYDFKSRHAKQIIAHGVEHGTYNYRLDAVRFAHKTAAVIEAVCSTRSDILIWVDADTFTHSDVTMEFVDSMLPDNVPLAWLNRNRTYPECGFYMLDVKHPIVKELVLKWKSLYTDDTVFNLPEWHDSFVFQTLVNEFRLPWVSLSGNAANHSHPFINGPLGSYMDHMKGPRKSLGKSKPSDLISRRHEAYWK